MIRYCLSIFTIVITSVTASTFGATFVEGFENGSSTSWSYGTGCGYIEDSGGNPGRYFRDSDVATFTPIICRPGPQINWNLREFGISRAGIDLIHFWSNGNLENKPLSLVLRHDNGTRNDFSDDWGAEYTGDTNIPTQPGVWQSYSFDIPYEYDGLGMPAGWDFIRFGTSAPQSGQWNDVITRVCRIDYCYGNPLLYYLLQDWDIGFDNVTLTMDNVPEPGSLALLGFGALALVRRRR